MRREPERTEPDGSRATDGAPRILVIGIGNEDRGDDAIGLEIARRVRDLCLDGVTVEELGGDPLSLLEIWDRGDWTILIDAVTSGTEAGTVMRFDALADDLPAIFEPRVSSHGIGVGEVVALARALDRLPARLVVYGIEGEAFDVGSPLSPGLANAIDITVERVAHEASRKG